MDTQSQVSSSQKKCRHVAFIKSQFLGNVLKFVQNEVVDENKDKCFIPSCHGTDMEKLKEFFKMGQPPIRTYHPINYIGIGLHNNKEDTVDNETDSGASMEPPDNVFSIPVITNDATYFKQHIFASPSCMYATLPEMASALDFEGLNVGLRIVIEVLVKPASYVTGPASVKNIKNGFDCCFDNQNIEWFVKNLDHIVPHRLLFRIMKKEDVVVPMTREPVFNDVKQVTISKEDGVSLITVLPSSSTKFLDESGFQSLKGAVADSGTHEDAVTILESPSNTLGSQNQLNYMVIGFKYKWTDSNNKIIYYLKTIIGSKWLEWDNDKKQWKIKGTYIYECVKYALYLGLRINDKVLFALWSWLRSIDMRNVGEVFSKVQLIEFMQSNKIWLFQRVDLKVTPGYNPSIHGDLGKGATPALQAAARESAETVHISLVPYNRDIVAKFKDRNGAYVWNKADGCWQTGNLITALEDLMAVLPHLKECSQSDTYLSSRGINLRDINKLAKRKDSGSKRKDSAKRRELMIDDNDVDDDFTTVTTLMLTAAGKEPHLMRIRDKIKTVVEKIAPPMSSISASGKIMEGGAGTGGIEFVEAPRGSEAWNKISLCVVPNESDGELPVDEYDPQLLASLIAEVFIVKEAAIDYLLANFKRWPGPHDTVGYLRWTTFMARQEPTFAELSFDARQRLAQSRLFCDEDFYISGSPESAEASLCHMLIELGNGKIVQEAKDAEYVIITDKTSPEALELKQKFANNDEDLISATHGARHSTLVTPKYIYDCIKTWQLQRPTKSSGHMAF
uniref:BRCT domain-containing protein n=1 Tax=Babesia bovis TaxID=5865 RepID=A7AQ24_BABBO|eukprot:XP_001612226.1 hypothetical protein [Babesia bovis T2Bo]